MLFENMDVWKRSRKMTIEVYRQTTDLKDYGFRDQITRSALSVPSNIAEGLERSSIPDKCRFLEYAKGSVGELRTQIDIGIEIGYISENIGIVWIQESYELAKMLAGLIKTLKKTSKLSK
jgi:four helix bundle protein